MVAYKVGGVVRCDGLTHLYVSADGPQVHDRRRFDDALPRSQTTRRGQGGREVNGFTLLVPGEPIAKGRPRVYNGHGVTPKRTRNAENRIYAEFRLKYPDAEPLQGLVRVDLEFWKPKRGKPDGDNLYKLVTDALNGVAYGDDKQIKEHEVLQREPDPIVKGRRPGTWRKRKTGTRSPGTASNTSRTRTSASHPFPNGTRGNQPQHQLPTC